MKKQILLLFLLLYRVLTEYHHEGSADIDYGKDVPFPLPMALKKAFVDAIEFYEQGKLSI